MLEFLLSKEEQKRLIMLEKTFTGIDQLYYDDDICSIVDCDLYRNLQLNSHYHYEREDYAEYSKIFRKYAYEFILGNITASEALDKINDITYIHQIRLDNEETSYGIVLFIITIVLSLTIIGSSLFFYIERFKPLFNFLPLDFWYVIILGVLCHLASIYTEYGEIHPYKCQLKVFLYSIGYTLTFIPFLYKLVFNLLLIKQVTNSILKKRYIFLLGFIVCDVVLTLINLSASYGAKTILVGNGKKYQECKMNDSLSRVVAYLSFGYKIIIFIGLAILSFLEWNIKETKFDIHFLITVMYANILSVVMMCVFKLIKFDNYITFCILNKIFFFIIIVSNYIGLLGIRIVFGFFNKKKDELNVILESLKLFQNISEFTPSTETSEETTESQSSKYLKVIDIHYQTSLSINN